MKLKDDDGVAYRRDIFGIRGDECPYSAGGVTCKASGHHSVEHTGPDGSNLRGKCGYRWQVEGNREDRRTMRKLILTRVASQTDSDRNGHCEG